MLFCYDANTLEHKYLHVAELTPMMKQFFEIKGQAPDCILFFRLGDFYEMFGDDAKVASEILNITLTARNKGDNAIPMCGIPYHAATGYIAKLTKAGKKVAICEQLSDPTLPGIVKREIIRIITPGTTIDENILENNKANYLAAITYVDEVFGLALVDISTGEFEAMISQNIDSLTTELYKYEPREILFDKATISEEIRFSIQKTYRSGYWYEKFVPADYSNLVEKHFGLFKTSGTEKAAAQDQAIAMVLDYLAETQKTAIDDRSLNHLKQLNTRSIDYLKLDQSTIRNLELLENLQEKKIEGSLISVLDKTVTSAGGRRMRKTILEPLKELDLIKRRMDCVSLLIEKQNLLLDLRLLMKGVLDIERIMGRLNLGNGNARDLRALASSLTVLLQISVIIEADAKQLMGEIGRFPVPAELIALIERAIEEEAPISIKNGGIIRSGYNEELDILRSMSREGKDYLQSLQAREIARTGINSLKVRFNKVFGYYIEVSKSNLAQVPDDYVRKQTLANAERFSTPELKEYEEKILTAEDKILTLETSIFEEICREVLRHTDALKESAASAAYLDVLLSMALVSWENHYCKPEISENYDLRIEGGRHPVIEKLNSRDSFMANDTKLTESERMALITGPNMGGKSTYLRQSAIIVLMAHLGMYVPAKSAQIPLVDRIFTRVGASDNLVRGQSTFWLEMEETALILKEATERSLLILDEIGRGTSTFDGVSIAWGVMEYIHDLIGAKTLFASHYHELIDLADKLKFAGNLSVKVEDDGNRVVFLYKVGPGGVDRSYGIEVARQAGLPDSVITRAREILKDLEAEKIGSGQQRMSIVDDYRPAPSPTPHNQRVHQGMNYLKSVDLDNMTPLTALNKLHELKKIIDQE